MKQRRIELKIVILGLFLVSFLCALPLGVNAATVDTPKISKIDVYEADLREVFRSLGELGNLSVLLDPEVRGSVTIGLKAGLTVQEAIELLAQTYGYSFRWLTETRTVIIGSAKTFVNMDKPETRVYHFNYAQTEQLVEVLKNIVPADKMGVDKRTNQLTITASALQHQNIAEVIKRLDQDMPQVTIEIRVEEVKRSLVESTGVVWKADTGSDDITLNFSQPAVTVVLTHYLQLWERNNQAKLLSNPKIATTDSQEGSIFIGDKYPVINSTTSTTDKTITYNVSYVDVGTKLSVTPRINENDTVTVNVKASVNNISEWSTVGSNKYPVVRNRDISSVIHLRDGETFVLSGLSEIQKLETTTGVKGLNKLPLIGWLFKNKTTDPSSDTEVCIFITPKIVKRANASVKNDNQQQEMKDTPKSANGNPVSLKPDNQNQQKADVPINEPAIVDQQQQAAANPMSDQTTESPLEQTIESTAADRSLSEPGVRETPEKPKEAAINPNPHPENSQGAGDNLNVSGSNGVKKVPYIIKRGNTIIKIALKYGINLKDILRENGLKPDAKLKEGTKIIIPVPENHLYQVKPKETFWRIAMRYGVNIQTLQEINHINDITKVKEGQEIILPVTVDQVANHSY